MSNYVLNNSINNFFVSFDTYLQENADHIGDRKFLALFVLKCQYLASQGWNALFLHRLKYLFALCFHLATA